MAERAALTRKMGPLPVWAWGIIGGIAVYFLYTRYHNASSSSTASSPTATVFDPNAVDPNTGLTYGQELGMQSSSLPANAPGTSLDPTANDLTGPLSGFDSELQAYLQANQDFGLLAGALGLMPPNPSATTAAAAASAPIKNAHGPPTKASSHHKQRTVHVKHPADHQHPVKHKTGRPHATPVKHPAAGGLPGKVQSGSHARPTEKPAVTRQIHRGGTYQRPPSRNRVPVGNRPPVRTPGRKPPKPVKKRRR